MNVFQRYILNVTHFQPILDLCRNQLPGLSIIGTLVENGLNIQTELFGEKDQRLHLRRLNRLRISLCTRKLMYYMKIKTRTSQSAEWLQAPWDLFSPRFKGNVSEFRLERTWLKRYEDILPTDNCLQIC